MPRSWPIRVPGDIERDPPVDADHALPPSSFIRSSRVAVPVPKWIEGQAGRGERGEDAPRIGQHIGLVIVRAERADPAIEELQRIDPGRDLRLR